jgi:hypothetical protein
MVVTIQWLNTMMLRVSRVGMARPVCGCWLLLLAGGCLLVGHGADVLVANTLLMCILTLL